MFDSPEVEAPLPLTAPIQVQSGILSSEPSLDVRVSNPRRRREGRLTMKRRGEHASPFTRRDLLKTAAAAET